MNVVELEVINGIKNWHELIKLTSLILNEKSATEVTKL